MLTRSRSSAPTGGISLSALPKPASLEDYERASDEIEGLLRSLPGVVAVYRTGGVSAPGISDLDRIAVLEHPAPTPAVWPRLSEDSRHLAMHTPFLVDRAIFRRHRWFAHLEPLKLASGSAVELEDPPMPEYCKRLLGAESLLVSLLRTFKQLSVRRLKVRPSLCELNNVRHGLALAGLSREDAPSAWRVADDVVELRQEWFMLPNAPRNARVTELATDAVPALLDALWVVGERMGPVDEVPRHVKLGPPWSNVALVQSDRPARIAGATRTRLPFTRSRRAAELRWRTARPEVPVHPGLLAFLVGGVDEDAGRFRSARDELVRAHREFIRAGGRGYSPIGQASPFVSG